MSLFREIFYLLQKEILLEWRRRYAISGIILYVFSTVFIVYVSATEIAPDLWNILYWIIMLFASVNAVAKSFVQEGGARQLYHYNLMSPTGVLLSKVIYNVLLLLVLNLLTFLTFSFVVGHPVEDAGLFASIVALGSLGFGITFTFISSIAHKTKNSAIFMAILSFPVIIPMLMILVKVSASALGLSSAHNADSQMAVLLGIDLVMLGLTIVLFPYLWRD